MNNSGVCRRISSIAIDYNASDKGYAKLVHTQNLFSSDPKEIIEEMLHVASKNERVGKGKFAFTGYISAPHDAALSDEELTSVALEALRRMGMTDKNQVLLHIHGSTKNIHIHFLVHRLDMITGRCTIKSSRCGQRLGEAVRDILKSRNIKTDIELGKEKKDLMLGCIIDSIKLSSNFNQFVEQMNSHGMRATLSENARDGISGMRVVRYADLNPYTKRQYKPGYTLSQITNKLKIAEFKEIFEAKDFLIKNQDSFKNIERLKYAAERAGITIRLKHSEDRNRIENVFISLNNNAQNNGFFRNKILGFDLKEIAPDIHLSMINQLNSQLGSNYSEKDENTDEKSLVQNLSEVIQAVLRPSFASGSEDPSRRKKNNIYDDEPRFRKGR